MKRIMILLFLLIPSLSFGYTQDSGKITRIYTSKSGAMAFQLDNGLRKAKDQYDCSAVNGWAGLHVMDGAVMSSILTAKSQRLSITVTIDGCEGGWFKIMDVYLN